MEKSNAVIVKKALECCSNWHSIKDCEKCPLNNNGCVPNALEGYALALINSQEQRIKELGEKKNEVFEKGAENLNKVEEAYLKLEAENLKLTEENERLRAEVSVKKKLLDEAERRYDETAKRFYKEGVKDIQSEIKKSLSALCKGDVSEIHRMIDQTAKELLEGKE